MQRPSQKVPPRAAATALLGSSASAPALRKAPWGGHAASPRTPLQRAGSGPQAVESSSSLTGSTSRQVPPPSGPPPAPPPPPTRSPPGTSPSRRSLGLMAAAAAAAAAPEALGVRQRQGTAAAVTSAEAAMTAPLSPARARSSSPSRSSPSRSTPSRAGKAAPTSARKPSSAAPAPSPASVSNGACSARGRGSGLEAGHKGVVETPLKGPLSPGRRKRLQHQDAGIQTVQSTTGVIPLSSSKAKADDSIGFVTVCWERFEAILSRRSQEQRRRQAWALWRLLVAQRRRERSRSQALLALAAARWQRSTEAINRAAEQSFQARRQERLGRYLQRRCMQGSGKKPRQRVRQVLRAWQSLASTVARRRCLALQRGVSTRAEAMQRCFFAWVKDADHDRCRRLRLDYTKVRRTAAGRAVFRLGRAGQRLAKEKDYWRLCCAIGGWRSHARWAKELQALLCSCRALHGWRHQLLSSKLDEADLQAEPPREAPTPQQSRQHQEAAPVLPRMEEAVYDAGSMGDEDAVGAEVEPLEDSAERLEDSATEPKLGQLAPSDDSPARSSAAQLQLRVQAMIEELQKPKRPAPAAEALPESDGQDSQEVAKTPAKAPLHSPRNETFEDIPARALLRRLAEPRFGLRLPGDEDSDSSSQEKG
eukprot:TRINITY_DN14985_c0_g1_i1.p1 TRINITY_DN14985_c0_g1~~TRINITY_DN14985_c0_g1_i1.p1  ORF type:complete len:649 (-),score=134.79 TRINITY_DN14985_c0_g1_i1:21-1967(-)